MWKRVVQSFTIIAALCWSALYIVSLWPLTYVYCYGEKAGCGHGMIARTVATTLYFAGLVAGWHFVKWIFRLIEHTINKKADGIM